MAQIDPLARLESLIQRRPFLLSNVTLRQNPSNVYEWQNRIKLSDFDPVLKVSAYTEALTQIDPLKAYGKPSSIWIDFAYYYEVNSDILNANKIFAKSITTTFKSIDETASLYLAWAEMHIR